MTRLRDTRIAVTLMIVMVLAAFVLVGCDQQATVDDTPTPTDSGDAVDDPATDADDSSSDDEPTEARAEGDLLIDELCTRCHSRIQVDAVTDRDRAGWDATIDRMIQNGANVTDMQRQAILDYLVGS